MREGLKNIEGIRKRFTAVFVRYGKKNAFRGLPITTLLFSDVKDKYGETFCDHIWFTTTKEFAKYNFTEGDGVSFDARVKQYIKGYRGRRDVDASPISKDYKLSHPKNIVKNEVNSPNQLFPQ